MNAREVIKLIKSDGWAEARVNGSHRQFEHSTRLGVVTVPDHGSKDLKIGTLLSIERQSGTKLRRRK